jgi:8-oxo-(d)GTP phosphatase
MSPDEARPLTVEGRSQAEGLVAALASFDIARVVSSPYLRCTQTVAPLAAGRGLEVLTTGDLAEGGGRAALALVRGLAGGHHAVVLCTHGDVVEDVLDGLGVDRPGLTGTGATWILGGGSARRLPPPGERAPRA